MIFVHEPNMLQKSAISIFNKKTKKSSFVDIGELLENSDISENHIVSVNTDKENKLYILTSLGLIVWNMDNNKLITKYTDSDKTGFYIWINE